MKSARSSFTPGSLLLVLRQLALCAIASVSSHAQMNVYVQGQPTVGDPTSTVAATSASFLDATQFLSNVNVGGTCTVIPPVKPLTTDAAGQIQAAICALPTTGGTIDARGLGTGITFQSSPFADPTVDRTGATTTQKNVILLLPAGTITVQSTIAVPKQSMMIGEGSDTTTLMIGAPLSTWANFSGNCDSSGSNPCYPVVRARADVSRDRGANEAAKWHTVAGHAAGSD
jgi:hypothetical protein